MIKNDARRRLRELSESWEMLEISLRNVREMLASDECPEPWDRWDAPVEMTDEAIAEISASDTAEKIGGVVEWVEKLIEELPE